MQRNCWRVFVVSLLLHAASVQAQSSDSTHSPVPDAELLSQVTGSWRLISVETIRANGEIITEWMGKQPQGLIIYLQNGLMSVQIMRDPRPRFEGGSRFKATPEELKAAYLGYYAYWGRYSVNSADKSIIHNVESSLWPEEVGITYTRYISFQGSKLVLTTAPYKRGDEERRNVLIWERTH